MLDFQMSARPYLHQSSETPQGEMKEYEASDFVDPDILDF